MAGRRRRHQRVERHLVDVELEQGVDVGIEHRERLAGQVEDHVHVERGKDAADRREPRAHLAPAAVFLQAIHAGEQAVVEALHADREARDAGVAVALQHLGLEVVRVGLDRNRAHRRQLANERQRGEQLARMHGRRAAPDVQVAEAEARLVIEADLAAQGLEVTPGPRLVVAHAVERAERAQHLAERHVHVQLAGSRRRRRHHLERVVLVETHRTRVLAAQDVEEGAFEPEHLRSVSVRTGAVFAQLAAREAPRNSATWP